MLMIVEQVIFFFLHSIQENQTSAVTFILVGFSEYTYLQVPLFLLFLTIYTVTVMGNLGMIAIIRLSPKLHTPMYFFLSYLSFVDFCYSTVVTPKLLENLIVEDRRISFIGCVMQFFFACIFVVTETFMLAVMAYDRFVAVCNPLLYTVAMSQKLCWSLVAASYSWSIMCSSIFIHFMLTLVFCGTKFINNFVCEYDAIVAVACSDPYISQKVIFIFATFNELSSLMIILTSYVFIVITVMKMPTTGGCYKVFSTCASHLTTITIYHSIIICLYCVPTTKSSWLLVKVASVFYTVIIPMLNPLIYSLRNKDVKDAVKKMINVKEVQKERKNERFPEEYCESIHFGNDCFQVLRDVPSTTSSGINRHQSISLSILRSHETLNSLFMVHFNDFYTSGGM
uniref:olfactory receptor 5D13-like n=1 Tax=Arvicanthis niloticus TaxID=61156 RepID=UPI0014866CBA|nr:olfactory receptor 5D13-like [Arvicanthis niloticus]